MQIVDPQFNALAKADIRPISQGFSASFDKQYNDNVLPWTWDKSVWDGGDMWIPAEDNPLQAWDYYLYKDYSERVMYQTVTRELRFPHSTASSIADFQLNNYDKYFTPNSSSPIGMYIRPGRAVRLFQGFNDVVLQQFVGLTQGMPEVSRTEGTVSFTAMDFLTWIYEMPIRQTIAMANVRTDEVLANIFDQFGLNSNQYDLAKARNTIPFLFFERDQQTAGDVIDKLMQAEMGMLWLDELGIIRFRPRLEQPTASSYTLDADSIIEIDTAGADEIINHVTINTDVRELQEFQQVYYKQSTDNTLNVVPAGGTYIFPAELQDPCLSIVQPTRGENSSVSWFTASLPNGQEIGNGVSILSVEPRANSYDITFSNTNTFDVNINQLFLWGEPGRKISLEPEVYDAYDDGSVKEYEEHLLVIDNNFIQNISQADSLARTILDEYAGLNDLLDLEIRGNPALQLSDIVTIDYGDYSGTYRIVKMVSKVDKYQLVQHIRVKRYNPRNWWTWDVSVWDGTDVFAP